jgi:hypothetical protein
MTPLRLTLALAAALLAAGCGSNAPHTTSAGQTQSFSSFVAEAFKHAQCMRSHGVPNYPDPVVVNTNGEQGIRQRATPGTDAPRFAAAAQACKHLLPDAGNGTPAQDQAHTQALLAFARCLRGHGVSGFPDPTATGDLTPQMLQAAGIDLQSSAFLAAAQACVGVTRGMITMADVQRASHRLGTAQASSGPGS